MSIYTEALKFYWKGKTRYRVHSPFLYNLVDQLLDDRRFYAFDQIEYMRKKLLESKDQIKMIDLGAGSRSKMSSNVSISQIAKNSLSSPWQCQILFKLAQNVNCDIVVELGSSLGISSAYLGKAIGTGKLYSFEGNADSIKMAKNVCSRLKLSNVEFVEGNFDQTLKAKLAEIEKLDLVFLDGNHRKNPTLQYFEWVKPKLHEGSVLVFDDIYWSQGMKESWEQVKSDPLITATLDFFYFGLAFVNSDFKEKKHLRVLESKWKPWQKYI